MRPSGLPPRTLLKVATLLALSPARDLASQTRRALLIGINTYERFARGTPGAAASARALVTDLDGAVNDAESMRDLLRARFGFEPSRIEVLEDTAATRERILAAIRHLSDEAQPGDVVFFFYAGHGSQRRNSKSARPTKLDQTIVPADANTGVYDVRDKELARLFGQLMAKGAAVTLIFDSCHSGAIARGVAVQYKERWAAVDPRDAADSEAPPAPEDHGALVISSAQDYQTAGETKDDANVPHGVFSSALMSVLRSVAPNEPAARIFQRVKAIMQSSGRPQEPVLAGTMERRQQPLLGGVGAAPGLTTVAVLRMGGPGEVELQGGPAIGLREKAELVPFGRQGAPAIRLKVTRVLGLSHSTADVIEGSRDSIHPGDLFQIDQWAPSPAAGLRVSIPPAGLDRSVLPQLQRVLDQLRQAAAIAWVEDPTDVPADSTALAVLRWGVRGWVLEVPGRPPTNLPRFLSAQAVERALLPVRGKARLFALLPPSPGLAAHLDLGRGGHNDLVDVVADPQDAQYLLVGRLREGRVEYAWIRPNASHEMAQSSTLPIRGDWVAGDSAGATRLVDQALRLAKVRSWLEMEGPPGGGGGRFPYYLALRNPATGELQTQGPVYEGDYYGLALRADSAELKPWLEPRRVYVFAIDSYGTSTLLFPLSNVLNVVPYEQTADGKWPTQITLGQDTLLSIQPPFGMDTYVLLTSDEVIPTEALAWEGVRTGKARGGSPLASLLFGNSNAMRGPTPVVPVNWSIERLSILSAPRPGKSAP